MIKQTKQQNFEGFKFGRKVELGHMMELGEIVKEISLNPIQYSGIFLFDQPNPKIAIQKNQF